MHNFIKIYSDWVVTPIFFWKSIYVYSLLVWFCIHSQGPGTSDYRPINAANTYIFWVMFTGSGFTVQPVRQAFQQWTLRLRAFSCEPGSNDSRSDSCNFWLLSQMCAWKLSCKLFSEKLRVEMPKMPKVPKMPKMVERAFSTINLIYCWQ